MVIPVLGPVTTAVAEPEAVLGHSKGSGSARPSEGHLSVIAGQNQTLKLNPITLAKEPMTTTANGRVMTDEAVALAAVQARHDRPNNDHPADTTPPDKARTARARMKALVALDNLIASDPDFDGIELTTDKLFAYVRPPKEYYRALVDLGISLFGLAAMRDMSSADLKRWLQNKVKATGYSVPKNCCNKPLFDWQLEEIAKATGVPFDRRRINSVSKIQAYAEARAAGDDMWTPFNLSGFYNSAAVSFVEGSKPGKHKLFKNSTGYPVFKRNGKQITVPTFKALIGE